MRVVPPRIGSGAVVVALAALAVLSGCGGSPAGDSPSGVVQSALDLVADKDLDQLATLACKGQEEAIRGSLGLPLGGDADLLPGIGAEAILDAIELDVSDLDVGGEQVSGDEASVEISGDLHVSFDADTLRPLLKQVLEAQGTPTSDDQLDLMIGGLGLFGQSVPVSQDIRLVREDGAWKICQQP